MPRENENRNTQPMTTNASAFSCRFPPEGGDFGRYQNLVIVGEGGMGRVYRAYDPMLGIDLAVKVIPRGLHSSEEERRRFTREAKLLATINVPGVVRLFDCGDCDGWQYYTMEFLEGDTLDDYADINNLSMEQRLQYIQQLATILQKLHASEIIHRDLKPSNVIITEKGELRLTDFGIAKSFDESRPLSAITMNNSRPGTPFYMSPEPSNVLQNLGAAKKADVYSLAVMAYELIAGKLPYDVENLTATECVLVIREEPPQSFADRNVDIPLDIDILIMSALDKDIDKRPNAGAFALGLKNALSTKKAEIKPAKKMRFLPYAAAFIIISVLVLLLHHVLIKNRGQRQHVNVTTGTDAMDNTATDTGTDTSTDDSTGQTETGVTDMTDDGIGQGTGGETETGTGDVITIIPENDDDDTDDPGDETDNDPPKNPVPTVKEQFQASLVKANEYLKEGKWTKAEDAFLKLKSLPGYETCNETPVGIRKAKCGRLFQSATAAEKNEDWETVMTLLGNISILDATYPGSSELKAKAVKATSPVLSLSVWQDGREVKGSLVIIDGKRMDSLAPFKIRIDKMGKHSLEIITPRAQGIVYTRYNSDFYMGPRPQALKIELECLKTLSVNDLNMDMIPIAAGQFRMGGGRDVKAKNPGYTVQLTQNFWISKHEVNQDQYFIMSRSNPSGVRGADYPVTRVSWSNALVFCRRLTEREKKAGRLPKGYIYRLPTEAEWEYCCKAGTDRCNVIMKSAKIGQQICFAESKRKHFATVGYGQANAWGLYNMQGNVREWVWDKYGHYPVGTQIDPQGPIRGTSRVVRGGSWKSSFEKCASIHRERASSASRVYADVGFRIVLGPEL